MLNLTMQPQPDGVSCGATCLHALYHYFGDPISLEQVILEAPTLEGGGTLVVLLGTHALVRGYKVVLNSLNPYVIDPSWFALSNAALLDKLRAQLLQANDRKVLHATQAYIRFLELGGEINFSDINLNLIHGYIDKGLPLISGVSATYLYQNMRDYTGKDEQVVYDEWKGAPSGHVVIVQGCSLNDQTISLADPYLPHPLSETHYYTTTFSHWLHAHLLGSITYDTELLVIQPAA